jgi:hypothetical protein
MSHDPYAKFRGLSLEQLRANITTSVYLGAEKALAQAFFDGEMLRLSDADNLEQKRIARSAKNAAWIAAIAAIIAAMCAIISIWPHGAPPAPTVATHPTTSP